MRLSFSTLLLMASFWWIYRYGGYDGNLASHILLSQRSDPKEKQVISLDQDVHGLINYQDSKATMAKLYIINRSLTSRIQSHTRSRGMLNNPEDDLLAKEN